VPPINLDFLWSLRTGLRGMAVVATQDRIMQPSCTTAAAVSRSATRREHRLVRADPVAQILGDLAMLLDRPAAACEHYTEALRVAETWKHRSGSSKPASAHE